MGAPTMPFNKFFLDDQIDAGSLLPLGSRAALRCLV